MTSEKLNTYRSAALQHLNNDHDALQKLVKESGLPVVQIRAVAEELQHLMERLHSPTRYVELNQFFDALIKTTE